MRTAVVWVLLGFGLSGCFVSRAGTGAGDGSPGDGGAGFDAAGTDAQRIDAGQVDTGPCVPSGPDLCNNIDDDCDPSTADGSGDSRLGVSCDDPVDTDLCSEGTILCVDGILGCTGDDGDNADEVEVCDSIDNDCNPATVDGAGDVRVGAACDDPGDPDLCPNGVGECNSGTFVCNDSIPIDPREICDNVDNDCNAATPDGADDPMLGVACDAPGDIDLCEDGALVCSAGTFVCLGDGGDLSSETELCDGLDNDCNPATPDGALEPGFGVTCDGTDGDACFDGTFICDGTSIVCSDDAATLAEICNGVDDDCDTMVDEDGCPCTLAFHNGDSYLFCGASGDRRHWSEARDACRAASYELVSIDDLAEQSFVATTAGGIASDREWWTGANDQASESNWVWVADGSAIGYQNWRGGEPNDFAGGEDCGTMRPDRNGSSGTPGGWNDDDCGNRSYRYICEIR